MSIFKAIDLINQQLNEQIEYNMASISLQYKYFNIKIYFLGNKIYDEEFEERVLEEMTTDDIYKLLIPRAIEVLNQVKLINL